MAVNLSKGQKISLDKGMTLALVGLGWDTNRYDGGAEFDLDASAFLLGANGKVRKDEDFIFYGNLKSADGSVTHTGDNRTGEGEGDDEISEYRARIAKANLGTSCGPGPRRRKWSPPGPAGTAPWRTGAAFFHGMSPPPSPGRCCPAGAESA